MGCSSSAFMLGIRALPLSARSLLSRLPNGRTRRARSEDDVSQLGARRPAAVASGIVLCRIGANTDYKMQSKFGGYLRLKPDRIAPIRSQQN